MSLSFKEHVTIHGQRVTVLCHTEGRDHSMVLDHTVTITSEGGSHFRMTLPSSNQTGVLALEAMKYGALIKPRERRPDTKEVIEKRRDELKAAVRAYTYAEEWKEDGLRDTPPPHTTTWDDVEGALHAYALSLGWGVL